MKQGFTLIELIVVIIIVGILAAVGISQYSKTVEKSRGVEAKMILGDIVRKYMFNYYLENGTLTGISDSDVNIGTGSDQFPSACRSTHYFYYFSGGGNEVAGGYCARRCSSGGKTPQGDATKSICFGTNFTGGTYPWCGCAGADCWTSATACGPSDY